MKRGILKIINFYLILSLTWVNPAIPLTCGGAKDNLKKSLDRFQKLLAAYDDRGDRRNGKAQRKLNKPKKSDRFTREETKVLKRNQVDAQFLISSIKVMEFINKARRGLTSNDQIKTYLEKLNEEKTKISKYTFEDGHSGKIYMESLDKLNECFKGLKASEKTKIDNCLNKNFDDAKMVEIKRNLNNIEDQYMDKVEKYDGTETFKHNDLTFKEELRFQYLKTLTDYHSMLKIKGCKSPYGEVQMNSYLSSAHCALIGNNKSTHKLINNTHDVIVKLIDSYSSGSSPKGITDFDQDGIIDKPNSRFSSRSSNFRNRGRRNSGRKKKDDKSKERQRIVDSYEDDGFRTTRAAPKDTGSSGAGWMAALSTIPYFLNIHNNQRQFNTFPSWPQGMYYGGPGDNASVNSVPIFDNPFYRPDVHQPYLFWQPAFQGGMDQLNVPTEFGVPT